MGLKVAFIAPEAAPFSKTGGLADVAGSLPKALKRLGADVALFVPFHRETAESNLKFETTGIDITVPLWRRRIKAEVLSYTGGEVPVYFIKRDELFDRSFLYGTPEGDYYDNLERFAFFSRAVLEALKEGGSFVPIRGFEFLVDTLRVSAGARVTWVNCEAVSADPHTVTSDNGVWNSPLVAVGASFTRTFDVRGTFPYHCTPHPHMRAVVIVQ